MASDIPSPTNYNMSIKRGDSISSNKHGDDSGEFRRHKRAISVTPEKMIPSTPLPLDANAPPPARLSMRRHSALESSIRDPSDFFKAKEAAAHQHSNGLCSSPSTPGRTRLGGFESESALFNNMTSFNNSFNQSFNSVNNTNINISQLQGNNVGRELNKSSGSTPTPNSSSGGKKYSPSTPRREVVDEEDINKFLKTTSNELIQSSRDVIPPLSSLYSLCKHQLTLCAVKQANTKNTRTQTELHRKQNRKGSPHPHKAPTNLAQEIQ
jgi:hypothetical protein